MNLATRVALVTWSGLPGLSADDQLLAEALRALGAAVAPVAWDDAAVGWDAYDSVILRSCWDYHRRLPEFLLWLRERECANTPLFNPAPTVRWNVHKRYLLELGAAGVPVVETKLLARGTPPPDLAALMRQEGWPGLVVKPAVSASAEHTFATEEAGAPACQPRLDSLLAERDMLVQPLLGEVATRGEWSLMFVGGVFSHAVLKEPQAGDFRVQSEFGGRHRLLQPDEALRAAAARVLAAVPYPWLYARVDGVEAGGGFTLMELELIEPSMFLSADPAASRDFAGAILGLSSTARRSTS